MLKILYAFRSLLASELAVWTVYREVLLKKHKIKCLLQLSGLQVISEITFSLDLWVVHSATVEDFFHFQVFSSHFQVFSVINYVLFTYKGHQRRSDFPRVTASKPALPDVPCSSIFTKGREPLLGSFSTHSPLQDFTALVFPH